MIRRIHLYNTLLTRALAGLWLGLILCTTGWAQTSPETLLQQGHTAYAAQDYQGAAEAYQRVLDQGLEHALLHYNLGNAHYKMRQIAQAILDYERALKLDPSLDDARVNLQLTRLQLVDKIEPKPQFIVQQWASDVFMGRSAGQWAQWALLFLWLGLGFGALFVLGNITVLKRIGFFGGLLCLVIALSATLLGFQKHNLEQDSGEAIIMASNAYVKNAPGGDTDLLILHAGAKVEILESMDKWTRIRVEGVNIGEVVGFVAAENLEKI